MSRSALGYNDQLHCIHLNSTWGGTMDLTYYVIQYREKLKRCPHFRRMSIIAKLSKL